MIDPRTSRFWRLALQSELIDVRGLSDSWESIPPERRASVEHLDRRLARQAIQANLITLWQAQQILAGRFSGFKVGRYILMELIGQGGMGRVYLAKDTRLDRTVALKILSADRVKNPRAIARFQREAKVGAQLQHENLVRIYDFGESEGRHYLVMEYIEGRTIGSLIGQQGPIPPAIAAGLGRQIALGLEHAHKKGLVHRDVNPYNIMVTYDGTAKLADLGLAFDTADTERFTRDGATVGTFDYVAPEQARHSHSADIRSDIYSLGCTLYHMIAAEVPFPTQSLPEKLFAHQSIEPTPLNQIVPGVADGLSAGIGRMMRKLPDERFTTPLQVAQMLEPFADPSFRVDPEEFGPRSREEIRPGPEAKTLMIPRLIPELNRGSATVPNPVPDHPTVEITVPDWNVGPDRRIASIGTATASDLDLPLMLDLGPEPSLSEVLAESRTFPRSRTTPGSISGVWGPKAQILEFWRHLKSFFTPTRLLGALILAIAFSAGVAATVALRARPDAESPRGRTTPVPVSKLLPSPVSARPAIPDPSDATQAPILVRMFDQSGPDIPVNTLSEAINRAIGNRGIVVLRNRAPLTLNNDSLIEANLNGDLLIRAEEGFEPVLEINLSRPGPFLRSGANLSVTLEGLTVRVRSATASTGSPDAARSTIIQAAGPLTIKRCDFKVLAGSVDAIHCDGGTLNVEKSRFEGFDRAIEIQMYRKLAATIRQTIIVSDDADDWGLKVSHNASRDPNENPPNLQLVLDHCTSRGAGLLALSGFSTRSPLRVKLTDCIIRADVLIDWDPKDGDPSWSQLALPWSGRGNRYEILDKSWVRQVAENPPTENSTAGADLSQVGPSVK